MTHDTRKPIDTRRPTPESQNEQLSRLASDMMKGKGRRSWKIVEIKHSTRELVIEATTKKGD